MREKKLKGAETWGRGRYSRRGPGKAGPAEIGRLLVLYELQPVPHKCAKLCAAEETGGGGTSRDSDWAQARKNRGGRATRCG